MGGVLHWPGSWIRFRVCGTTKISVRYDSCLKRESVCYVAVYIDNEENPRITAIPKRSSGELIVATGLSSGIHTVLIQVDDYFTTSSLCRNDTYFKIYSFGIDAGGTFSSWKQHGEKTIHFIGDSWAGCVNNVTRFMADKGFVIEPVGFGGFTAKMIVENYENVSSKVTIRPTDLRDDLFVIEYGINDYNGKISTEDFKNNVIALIEMLQKYHGEDIQIFFLQIPRYIAVADDESDIPYDMYASSLTDIEKLHIISTECIWDKLTWLSDKSHLNYEAKKALADFVLLYLKEHI